MAKIPLTGKVPVEIRAAWILENKPLGKCGHVLDIGRAILMPHDETHRMNHALTLVCTNCGIVHQPNNTAYQERNTHRQQQRSMAESYRQELLDARGRDSHQSEYVAQSTVKETYEFTQGEIDAFLGEPDRLARNPHHRSGAQMRLYLRTRVEAVRDTEAYLRSRMKRRRKQMSEYLAFARKLFTIQNSR